MPVLLNKRLLSVKEASEYLGIGRSTLYPWIKEGVIPSIKIKTRRLLDVLDLDDFIERLKGEK